MTKLIETTGVSTKAYSELQQEFMLAEYKELRAEVRQKETLMTQLFLTGVVATITLTLGISVFFFNLYIDDPTKISSQLSYFFLAPIAVIIPILKLITAHRRDIRRFCSYMQVVYEEQGFGPTWESSHQKMALMTTEEAHDFVPMTLWSLFGLCIGLYFYGIVLSKVSYLWLHILAPAFLCSLMLVNHILYQRSKHQYYAKLLLEWREIYRQINSSSQEKPEPNKDIQPTRCTRSKLLRWYCIATEGSEMKVLMLKFVAAVIIPSVVLVFVISMRVGIWDRWFGLDKVEKVAEKFESSYSSDASHPVRIGDPAWTPILRLISKYSNVDLPKDKEPRVLARFVAVLSGKTDLGQGRIAEWTAPSTPIALLYRDWPGQDVPREDYRIVGTIGDLRAWINRSKDDFRFVMQDILLAVLSITLGAIIWVTEAKPDQENKKASRP